MEHNEWLPMLKEIGISSGYAGKLMRISRQFSNSSYESNLPNNVTVLYELSRMDPSDIEDGTIGSQIYNATMPKYQMMLWPQRSLPRD